MLKTFSFVRKLFRKSCESEASAGHVQGSQGVSHRHVVVDRSPISGGDESDVNFLEDAEHGAFAERGEEEYKGVIADCTRIINNNPANATAYKTRGYSYLCLAVHAERPEDSYHFGSALADYTKAIELCPTNAKAYYGRGFACFYLGKFDQAIADYSKAIEIDPRPSLIEDLSSVYLKRGRTSAEKGNFDAAVADFDKAIGLDPENAVALNYRGDAYHKKGELDRAIADFTAAIVLEPAYADAYVNRAFAYEMKHDQARAISDYRAGMELEPQKHFAKNRLRRLGAL